MRFVNKIGTRLEDDRGAEMFTMLVSIVIMFSLIMTIIDFSLFLTNRGTLSGDLKDGARLTSELGGWNTPISKSYGATCNRPAGFAGKVDNNLPSCLTAKAIDDNHTYVQFTVKNVRCGAIDPNSNNVVNTGVYTVKVGQAMSCQADYEYNGVAGSAMSLVGSNARSLFGISGDSANPDGWNKGQMRQSVPSEVTVTNN